MTREGAYRFGRGDLEATLFADNARVHARFREAFPDLIQQFLDESDRVCTELRRFGDTLARDVRAAWVEAFVFSAFNSSFTSCHLLISGLPIPAGNLMRHYAEASAMALLCSHHAIDVVTRLDAEPTQFPVQKALQLVHKPRNTALLRIDGKAWKSFEAISKWYDDYSHASVLSLATNTMRAAPGCVILGGEFDDGKMAQYRKELKLRVSAMSRLCDVAVAVQENTKARRPTG